MTYPNDKLLTRLCWISVAVGSLLFGPALLDECVAKPAVFHATVAEDPADPYEPIAPETFTTAYSAPGGTTHTPADATALQTALDNASLGDKIVLDADVTYTGNFTLPDKGAGTDWIYIISDELASLPEGTRVVAADADHMPIIQTTNSSPAIQTEFGSHHYRFAGVQIQATDDLYNIVLLGFDGDGVTQPTSTSELPHHITFDRCYIRSTDDAKYAGCGILGDGKYIAVVDCRISNLKATFDAQAFCAWYGAGPYKIENNFLEATGENIMFGGEGVPITDSTPSDIVVQRNHLFKNPSWEGPNLWGVKNLFELKHAQRVAVTGNVMENNWADAQNGIGVLFTVRNQNDDAPWSSVKDVRFENNVVKNVDGGVNILAEDNNYTSGTATRIKVVNNLFTGLDRALLNLTSGGGPLAYGTFSNNTSLMSDRGVSSIVNFADSPALWANHFRFQNNLCMWAYYGMPTAASIATATDNATFSFNGFPMDPGSDRNAYDLGAFATNCPLDFKVDDVAAVLFTNYAGEDYSLQAGSPFHNAGSDGEDIGVDWAALQAAISGVEE